MTLPALYVAEHTELGYASTVHTAQGLTADTMHGIATGTSTSTGTGTGTESRQMLYTMLTRGRHANHVHLSIAGDGDLHQMLRPESIEPATATETLEAILARDGAAVSANTSAREACLPQTQLRDAATRYADAVLAAAHDVVGAALVLGWRLDGLFPANAGPLSWLPDIPANLADHPKWCAYLVERAERVDDLATMVRASARDSTPEWLPINVALPPDLVAVWRAAHCIPDSDRRTPRHPHTRTR